MSKIIAELDVKNTNAAAVAKGVRGKIERNTAPRAAGGQAFQSAPQALRFA